MKRLRVERSQNQPTKTKLYGSGVDEHTIIGRAGRRSSDGLKPYKRMCEILLANTNATIDNRLGFLSLQLNSEKEELIINASKYIDTLIQYRCRCMLWISYLLTRII